MEFDLTFRYGRAQLSALEGIVLNYAFSVYELDALSRIIPTVRRPRIAPDADLAPNGRRSGKISHDEKTLECAVANGWVEIVPLMIPSATIRKSYALCAAARYGSMDLTKKFIGDPSKLPFALFAAAEGNHVEVADFLASEIIREHSDHRAKIMRFAEAVPPEMRAGVDALAELPGVVLPGVEPGIQQAALVAADHKSSDILMWIKDRFAYCIQNHCAEMILYRAARAGSVDCIFAAVSFGAGRFGEALTGAAEGGHRDIAEFAVTNGARNFDEALLCAAARGHISIMEWLVESGATGLTDALNDAAEEGEIKSMKWLVDRGALVTNQSLLAAARGGCPTAVEWMLPYGVTDFNNALLAAVGNTSRAEERLTTIGLLLSLGANNLTEARSAAKSATIKQLLMQAEARETMKAHRAQHKNA